MRALTIKEVQEISVNILAYIDDVCRKNDIQYTIYYGSLIGAERHKGYVPWDDDLDIVMTRSNYERLTTLLIDQNEYLFLSPRITKNYRYTYSKLVDKTTKAVSSQYFNSEDENMGVFVDIFPIDGFPDTTEERRKFGDECELYRSNMIFTLNNSYAISHSFLKAMGKRILYYPRYRKLLKKGNANYWRQKYEQLTKKYPVEESKYCGYMEFINEHWGVFPTSWFDEYEDIEFEGHQFMAIKERTKFLELRYGDYMQLPPETERVTHHPYQFYQREDS